VIVRVPLRLEQTPGFLGTSESVKEFARGNFEVP
jgi:hypothetical protein